MVTFVVLGQAGVEERQRDERQGLKMKKKLGEQVVNGRPSAPVSASSTAATSSLRGNTSLKTRVPIFEDGVAGVENAAPSSTVSGWGHLPTQEARMKENTQAPSSWNTPLPSKTPVAATSAKFEVFVDEENKEEPPSSPVHQAKLYCAPCLFALSSSG